jgi:hypothetical protein
MSETMITVEKVCLRCGSSHLVSAHLEHPMAFCVDHVTHHGRVHVSLKALLCQDCGHVEFWVPDSTQLIGERPHAPTTMLQEEDF